MSTVLYHFCADRHAKKILREGLRIGGVWVPGRAGIHIYDGYTWLTTDGNPKRQSWATRILVRYSRTAWRLTIEIPDEYQDRIMDAEALEKHIPGTMPLFTGWAGSENWRVYRGRIPPEWIREAEKME